MGRMVITWLIHEWTAAANGIAMDLNNPQASDRSVAILAASLLDIHLRLAIERRLLHVTDLRLPKIKGYDNKSKREEKDIFYRLFDMFPGALTSLSTKIDIATALGIVSPNTYHDLAIIRKVRNLFAHKLEAITFDSADIAARCKALLSPKYVATISRDEGGYWPDGETHRVAETPREMYLSAVSLIGGSIFSETVQVRHPPANPLSLPWD